MARVASDLHALRARYIGNGRSEARELWHKETRAAPLFSAPIAPKAIAPVLDGAGPQSAERDALAPLCSEPKPLLTPKVPTAPEPTVVIQDIDVPEPPISVVPPTMATRVEPGAVRIHWHALVTAVGAGCLFGVITLFGMFWMSNRNNANANVNVSASVTSTAPALPKLIAPPIVTPSRPVPSAKVSEVSESPPRVVGPKDTLTAMPRPQAAARRAVPLATSTAPAAAKSVAASKPPLKKTPAFQGALPFSGNDLTF
jgi:hypothetical protein